MTEPPTPEQIRASSAEGLVPWLALRNCPKCEGKGEVPHTDWASALDMMYCPDCVGTGRKHRWLTRECYQCRGRGWRLKRMVWIDTHHPTDADKETCHLCQGERRIPILTDYWPGALLDTIELAGYEYSLSKVNISIWLPRSAPITLGPTCWDMPVDGDRITALARAVALAEVAGT